MESEPTRRDLPAPEGSDRLHPPSQAPIPMLGAGVTPVAGNQVPRDGESLIGRTIGGYVIEDLVAKGGFGAVYLARDVNLRRYVALKVMQAKMTEDEDALRRFQREARAAASINHPNVAQVFNVGVAEDGSPWLAMEFLEGGSLLDVLRRREVPTMSRLAEWMAQSCEGLRAARRQAVIHRDIKPANIMLTAEGMVKIVDFGLAKMMFDESYKTMEGTVLGTPRYMSPEQATGRGLDHRSDIYSLAATFYHLVTGRPPFDADSPVQIMMKHATAPLVPPRNVNPMVPQEFDTILCRAMRKDPNDRYQEYDELISDLRAVQLQCMAQERGSVLGPDGQQTGVSAYGGSRPSGVAVPTARSLTAIPAPPSFHSVQAPAAPAGGSRPPEDAGFGPPPSGLSPAAKVGVMLLMVMAIGIGVYLAIDSSGGGDAPPPAASDPEASGPRSPLATLLARVAEQNRGPNTVPPPDPDFIAYLATLEILSALSAAALSHEIAHGAWPRDAATLAASEELPDLFDRNSRGEPLDGWGRRIDYSRVERTLRSPGLNGSLFDADDIVYSVSEGIVEPDLYRELRDVDARRRRGGR